MPNIHINDLIIDAETISAHDSLLSVIRDHAGLSGTKEGCASGDCGACTVMLFDEDGTAPYTVNSCITPAGAAVNRQVVTVEGVGTPEALHPVQRAMVDLHGSQCGFCTPGFVVSLAAKTQQLETPGSLERAEAIDAISGNLCRCTGYRPILDAAITAATECGLTVPALTTRPNDGQLPAAETQVETSSYCRPTDLSTLLQQAGDGGLVRQLAPPTQNADAAADKHETQRWLVAGATDAFLEVTQRYIDPQSILDLSAVQALKQITRDATGVTLGSAVTHAEALRYFSAADTQSDAIVGVLKRFGSPQIRSRGTLGGNIANASPIADWPPLLLALNAELTITNDVAQKRRIPLSEFYLGYKNTVLEPNEIIEAIHIPEPEAARTLYAHKISKRFEDDISSVLIALHMKVEDATVTECRLAMGGVAATPVRCRNTEQTLLGTALTADIIDQAASTLGDEITPISDVRASAAYRTEVSQSLLIQALRGSDS